MNPNNRRMQVWSPGLLAVALGLAVTVGAGAAEDESAPREERVATVRATTLNVRAKPATRYEVICQLTQGEQLIVVGEQEGWYELRAPGRSKAWVAAQYIDKDGRITADQVRVHSGPGVVFTTYAYVNKGDQVTCLDAPVNGWQRVAVPPGATAWANSQYIELAAPAPEPVVAATEAPPAAAPATATEVAAPTAPATATEVAAPTAPATATEVAAPTAPATATEAAAPTAPVVAAAAPATTPPGPAESAPAPVAAETSAEAAAQPTPLQPPILVPAVALPVAVGPAAEAPAVPVAEVVVPPVGVEPPAPAATEPAAAVAPAGEPPAAPTAETPAVAAPAAERAQAARDGVVMSLGGQRSAVASHYLGLRIDSDIHPVCFLHSTHLNLQEWEGQEVRVHGREVWYGGWKRPVIEVTGIQLRRP